MERLWFHLRVPTLLSLYFWLVALHTGLLPWLELLNWHLVFLSENSLVLYLIVNQRLEVLIFDYLCRQISTSILLQRDELLVLDVSSSLLHVVLLALPVCRNRLIKRGACCMVMVIVSRSHRVREVLKCSRSHVVVLHCLESLLIKNVLRFNLLQVRN